MKFKMDFGAEIDVLTKDELDQSLAAAARVWYERYRGVKLRRIPLLTAVPAGGAVNSAGGVACGPEQGYAWTLRELNVEGLTAGTTPDVVNIYRGSSQRAGTILWQLNGNQFLQTFGRGEKILFPGETLYFASLGTFAATGTITLSGTVVEVPAERMAELAV